MSQSNERDAFDQAMATILRADPRAVKGAVDEEIRKNTAEREAKGEHKRGRRAPQVRILEPGRVITPTHSLRAASPVA
jgi:hypothetical protein